VRAVVRVRGGVGLLFEIWIVDASIEMAPLFLGGVVSCFVLFLFCLFVGMLSLIVRWCAGFFVAVSRFVFCVLCLVCTASLDPVCPCLGWVGCGLVVCVTSCEGHVVDALASRADEGRRSLR
jgi:hypothetical protein